MFWIIFASPLLCSDIIVGNHDSIRS
jgi:hypothetical protein